MIKKKVDYKNLKRTLSFTILLSLIAVSVVVFVQLNAEEDLVISCSYFDPIIIDILAFIVAIFLVIEGFARIIEHPSATLKRQFTRSIRIAIGFTIMSLHIIQYFHK